MRERKNTVNNNKSISPRPTYLPTLAVGPPTRAHHARAEQTRGRPKFRSDIYNNAQHQQQPAPGFRVDCKHSKPARASRACHAVAAFGYSPPLLNRIFASFFRPSFTLFQASIFLFITSLGVAKILRFLVPEI